MSLNVWLVVVYLGLICMSLPTVLQVWAQRVVPPHLAALLFLLEPVFANLLAFGLLGEHLGGSNWFGAALIFGALLVGTLPFRSVPKKAVTASVKEL